MADGTEGWYYAESEQKFAIAAAAEAAKADVYVQYSGYDPNGNGPGSGLYKHVEIALIKWA